MSGSGDRINSLLGVGIVMHMVAGIDAIMVVLFQLCRLWPRRC